MVNINFDEETSVFYYRKIKYQPGGGLYFLYDIQNNLLYIGWACYLKDRIRSHINGITHTKNFSNEIYIIRILYENSFDKFRSIHNNCQDIEYYLIDKLKPKYNKVKAVYNAYCNEVSQLLLALIV